jgi:hypothetical protein
MAIKAGGNSGFVPILAKLVVILDATRTYQKRVSISAVDAASELLSVLFLRFGLAPSGTDWISRRRAGHGSSLSTGLAILSIAVLPPHRPQGALARRAPQAKWIPRLPKT